MKKWLPYIYICFGILLYVIFFNPFAFIGGSFFVIGLVILFKNKKEV